MKRKKDIKEISIKNPKSHLNIKGSRMKKGVHYEQTYEPVASWNSIRLLLTLSLVHKWKTVHMD